MKTMSPALDARVKSAEGFVRGAASAESPVATEEAVAYFDRRRRRNSHTDSALESSKEFNCQSQPLARQQTATEVAVEPAAFRRARRAGAR
jgi:hypothetical protein